MKISIKIIVCLFVSFFLVQPLYALSLEPHELLLVNSLSRFIDIKPEGKALRSLEKALKSENPCVKGLGAIILYRHFGRQFKRFFRTAFTLNHDIDNFIKQERKLIKLESVNKILEALEGPLNKIKDDRVRKLFLFFHFRNIDLWLLGKSGEKLSMSEFYRINSLGAIFGRDLDVIRLAGSCDVFGK